jgi:hypothetical protein
MASNGKIQITGLLPKRVRLSGPAFFILFLQECLFLKIKCLKRFCCSVYAGNAKGKIAIANIL